VRRAQGKGGAAAAPFSTPPLDAPPLLPHLCSFMAFDRHMNLVLGDAEEFRTLPSGGAGRGARRWRRVLGLVLLRGDAVLSLAVEGPPPQPRAKGKVGASGGGPGVARAAGRGMPLAGTAARPRPAGLAGAAAPGVGAPAPGPCCRAGRHRWGCGRRWGGGYPMGPRGSGRACRPRARSRRGPGSRRTRRSERKGGGKGREFRGGWFDFFFVKPSFSYVAPDGIEPPRGLRPTDQKSVCGKRKEVGGVGVGRVERHVRTFHPPPGPLPLPHQTAPSPRFIR